ncbi:hypothetical protein B0H17DRAFT_854713, partial [Mycena rosella]
GSSSKAKGTSGARAVFSLYWGAGSSRNAAFTFEGTQTDARASLFGVLKALSEATPDRSLTVLSSSQYAIRSFCYWAGDNATRGWPCVHSDVLIKATSLIHDRTAPVEFRWVSSGAENPGMQAAKCLAK